MTVIEKAIPEDKLAHQQPLIKKMMQVVEMTANLPLAHYILVCARKP